MNRIVIIAAAMVSLVPPAAAGTDSTGSGRGWLGVLTENLSPAVKIALQVENGVIVNSVIDSGPADLSGIRVGDVIISVAGERIDATGDLRHAVRLRPNQTVEVQLLRQGRRQNLRVQLGTRPDSGERGIFDGGQFELEDMSELRHMLPRRGYNIPSIHASLGAEIDSLRAELEALRQELEALRSQLRLHTRGN